jgi:excisionase family DNA binding protein
MSDGAWGISRFPARLGARCASVIGWWDHDLGANEEWYPDVPPVMTVEHLAKLFHTNEQIIRGWVREGIIPAYRRPGGRKFTFRRHEIFDWLIANCYRPGTDDS